MNDLARWTIEAHGGLERWRRFSHVSAQLATGGVLWALKHQPEALARVGVRVALTHEWASHGPFADGSRTSFAPGRVAIETADGGVLEERLHPRDAFTGHRLDTAWDRLHLAYFAGYAMWTYLSTPFLFALDGVRTEELDAWEENGETWRRLQVTFPESIATHSTVQVFYVKPNGLIARHDYDADVLDGTPAAHYVDRYQEFSGIRVPTRRWVLARAPDGTSTPAPSIVTIDLTAVAFT